VRVLVACEFSGVVRDAFRRRGHDAWSCDLLEAAGGEEGNRFHLRGDVAGWLAGWDLLIAHPPCTFLCSSGLHWNGRRPGRSEETEKALAFVRLLMGADIERIAVENPIGRIGTAIRKADQIIQPYEFGHDASKQTALWLKGLPKLAKDPAQYVQPRWVIGKDGKRRPRWGNQTDSGQNKLGPSSDRWALRAETYAGIAEAMADQWGNQTEFSLK
jgi:hypothetical protein